MLSRLAVVLFSSFGASVVAQSSPSVICIAGQCIQGSFNTTIGAKLTAQGAPATIQLLPGQYTTTTNPELLHTLLTSSSASLTLSPGFENLTLSSLPLNLDLQPGLAIYSDTLYSGQAAFSPLPTVPSTNSTTPLAADSIAISSNVRAIVSSGSSNNHVVLWDSIPDISQLPNGASNSLSLLEIQSSACSPPCSGSGVCSASGVCTCPTGFTGSSCETCAEGFFGPTCQPCPAGCTSCDQGISGSGRCLTPVVTNAPSTCNCLNGECGTNGTCACNPGWTTASNGTACAACATGFFLTSTGDCEVCELGCTECSAGTAACISCKQGFTQDSNDSTKCVPLPSVTTSGTQCPDGSFGGGAQCTPCSSSCSTCTGPSSNDCIVCASGQYLFNGNCVSANSDGVCQGTNGMIANNNKNECDTCGAKCTSCGIPNFNVASTVNQLQCTGCLPGFVLSQGNCVESCPSGTFLSPQDNLTCTACSSSCSTCAGSANFCLTCSSNLLASAGQCVSTCTPNTFSSNGSCLQCHPDCATCSGPSFNQCSSCAAGRPVLTDGRCLSTCTQSQFFDTTSSTCQSCDSSCSSCSGSGPSNCLACSSSTQVLRGGSCVAANCNATSNVIPGLGVCLSELVQVPPSGTAAPPTVTGISDPTIINTRRPLAWWQILLMALGCAFIFIVILMLWRRRARKQRAKQTAKFASAKRLDNPNGWRWRLARFGERLFGHRGRNRLRKDPEPEGLPVSYNHHDYYSRPNSVSVHSRDIKLNNLRDVEKSSRRETADDDLEKFIGAYEYSTHSRSSRAPSTLPDLDHRLRHQQRHIERDSLYSEVTGIARHTPEPRQPVKRDVTGASNLSTSTGNSRGIPKQGVLVDLGEGEQRNPVLPLQMANTGASQFSGSLAPPTEAQAYVMSVRPGLANTSPAITPAGTGVGPSPFMGLPVPVTLTPNAAMGQGAYWLSPVIQQPFEGQQLQPQQDSFDAVILQPMNTGGSLSRNPFRQPTL